MINLFSQIRLKVRDLFDLPTDRPFLATPLQAATYRTHTPVRNLNIHEYQSKSLMDKYKINTQRWGLATTPEEAEKVATNLSTYCFPVGGVEDYRIFELSFDTRSSSN